MFGKILESKEDDTEALLINLDQFKAFDIVDYQFLAVILEIVGLTKVQPIDQYSVQILYGSGTGKQEELRGLCDQMVSLTGLWPVPFSLCYYFGAPASVA